MARQLKPDAVPSPTVGSKKEGLGPADGPQIRVHLKMGRSAAEISDILGIAESVVQEFIDGGEENPPGSDNMPFIYQTDTPVEVDTDDRIREQEEDVPDKPVRKK